MNSPRTARHKGRRLVKRVVLTYTVEGDPDQTEHTITLNNRGRNVIDGVVWSRKLIEKMAYMDESGRAERIRHAPATREDGVTKDDSAAIAIPVGGDQMLAAAAPAEAGTMSTGVDDPPDECVWFHSESCSWSSLC